MLYLYGASGHGKVVLEIAEELKYSIGGFIDVNPDLRNFMDYSVSTQLPSSNNDLIFSIGNNLVRKKLSSVFSAVNFPILIHPKTVISKRSIIDKGSVIMAGVTINSQVKIGKHCIVNTNASIDHDCVIGDFVHISPNAALAGNVQIGEGCHIGIGAAIIQGIKIGKWATIGAGAVIIKDVPDFAVVVGNPGKIIKYIEP